VHDLRLIVDILTSRRSNVSMRHADAHVDQAEVIRRSCENSGASAYASGTISIRRG